MKVTREEEKPEFRPFKIVISIETEEEAVGLRGWASERVEWLSRRARSGRERPHAPVTPLLDAVTTVILRD